MAFLKPKYLVIGNGEVFFSSDYLDMCEGFIVNTLTKYPRHTELLIYKLVD